MITAADLRQFDRLATLRDGTPVRIRAIRADDRQRLAAAFEHLDPDAVYTRFHGLKKSLSDEELQRISEPDFEHSVVLVMTLAPPDEGTSVAAASCNLLGEPGATDRAEVSFTVEEHFRGRGVSSLMLQAFIDTARERGLKTLVAEVLASNTPMLAVFEASGLSTRTTREDNVIHVEMSLDAAGAA